MAKATKHYNDLKQSDVNTPELKAVGKHSLGKNLKIISQANGKRVYRYDFSFPTIDTVTGSIKLVPRNITLGAVDKGYTDYISLAQAKDQRDTAEKLVSLRIDPVELRKRTGELSIPEGDVEHPFGHHLLTYLAHRKVELTPRYYETLQYRAEEYIEPSLGGKLLGEITPLDIRELVVNPVIEAGHYDLARRLVKMIKGAYDLAEGYHLWSGKNPADSILKVMPKKQKSKHYPALKDPKEVGIMWNAIQAYQGDICVKLCAELSMLTALRSAEIRFLKWSEVNFDEGTITLTKSRMKVKDQDHIVPMSKQIYDRLKFLEKWTGHRSEYVFFARRNKEKVVTDNGVLGVWYKTGYKGKHTPHGCRSTFRSLCADEVGAREDLLEHQLHHRINWPNGDAYATNAFLAERFEIMQKWADYLDEIAALVEQGKPIVRAQARAFKKLTQEWEAA